MVQWAKGSLERKWSYWALSKYKSISRKNIIVALQSCFKVLKWQEILNTSIYFDSLFNSEHFATIYFNLTLKVTVLEPKLQRDAL